MRPIVVEGRLLVPMRFEDDGVIGDGMVPIDDTHPDWAEWLDELPSEERERLLS